MLWVIVAASLTLFPIAAHAQSSACNNAEIVFVGRAEQPVTYHVSGEAAIERARQNLKRVEEEVARERGTLDLRTWWERNAEFELRLIDARHELDIRQGMYPPPHDLSFTPVQVEQAFRGVTDPTVMLFSRNPSVEIIPGEVYLISGTRSRQLIPPLPEMADIPFSEYVEIRSAKPAAAAQRELQFLAATVGGVTIVGTLRRESYGAVREPFGGIRIVVASEGQHLETTTNGDGSFVVSGIPVGRFEVRPFLPAEFTIINPSELVQQVRGIGCTTVHLTADLNGRVRGRIISASGTSLQGATLQLTEINPERFAEFRSKPGNEDLTLHTSHATRRRTTARADGSYEFFGTPPGFYTLSATVEVFVDGKKRTVTTFFPGTTRFTAAGLIEVGRASLHEGFDFVVRTD
jgi:hypothetical protein